MSEPLNLQVSPDHWLASMLDKPSGRLLLPADREISPEAVETALDSSGAAFVYSFIPVGKELDLSALFANRFALIDVQISLAKSTSDKALLTSGNIRFAKPTDEEEVAAIAENSFVYSRFHRDPQIPLQTSQRIKAEWARNYFRGERGESMVVAVSGKSIVGFAQLLVSDQALTIDLIAVAEDFRGKRLASELIAFAEKHHSGALVARVGTQLSNRASIRVYEAYGFRHSGAAYVLHLHR